MKIIHYADANKQLDELRREINDFLWDPEQYEEEHAWAVAKEYQTELAEAIGIITQSWLFTPKIFGIREHSSVLTNGKKMIDNLQKVIEGRWSTR